MSDPDAPVVPRYPSSAPLASPAPIEPRRVEWKRPFFVLLGIALFVGVWLSPPWSPAVDLEGKEFILNREGKLSLALFLVFVVMAVQYESLRNPLVIIFSVPFAVIGVVIGLETTGLPLSMPVWLGLIMLAGIVVNNAIVLVEYIELERNRGLGVREAVIEAARLRMRPILMTTLTTVVGMLPLALAFGEGSEMLQPLAVAIVSGLLFSALVSLLLVPAVYRALAGGHSSQ